MSRRIQLPIAVRLMRILEFPHKLGICERMFSDRLKRYGIGWVETAPGPIWKLDLANSTHRWIVYGVYEGPALLNWMKRNLPANPVIVDSGANIGQTALYFGTYFPKARVFSFEPGDYQANWLCECLARNSQLPVKVFRKGLSDSEKTLYLQKIGHECTHGGQNVVTSDGGAGDPIHVVRLIDVLKEEAVSAVDLWKLDVEGHELPALQGARDWLENKRIRALWIETLGENGRAITNFMGELGYRPCHLSRLGLETKRPCGKTNNTLFLPSE